MKKFFALFALLLLVVGGSYAQDDAVEVVEDPAASVAIFNFESGTFVETDEMGVFELTLNTPADTLDFLDVEPVLALRSFETTLFNLGFERAIENLETLQGLLVVDGQQVSVTILNFVEEEEFVTFTVEVAEVIATIDDKDAESLYSAFDAAEFYIYLDADTTQSLNDALNDLGLRGPNSF